MGQLDFLKELFPDDRTEYFALGREALVWALQRLKVNKGKEILLPGLICREVVDAIEACGIKSSFYRVSKTLQIDETSVEAAWNPQVQALLVVHYFGFPQNIQWAQEFCARKNLWLVEDNAHGLFSKKDGAFLGRSGDVGIFSFRKTLPVPNGAACVWNHFCPWPLKRSLHTASIWWITPFLVKRWARSWLKRCGAFFFASMILGWRRLKQENKVIFSSVNSNSSILNEYSLRCLRKQSMDQEVLRRHRLFEDHIRRIQIERDCELIYDVLPDGISPYGVPFFYNGSNPRAFTEWMLKKGLDVISWPNLPQAIYHNSPDHYKRLMVLLCQV